MLYLQKILKTKAKDVAQFETPEAMKTAIEYMKLRYTGTSYIGVFPQFEDEKGTRYRVVGGVQFADREVICSPSEFSKLYA